MSRLVTGNSARHEKTRALVCRSFATCDLSDRTSAPVARWRESSAFKCASTHDQRAAVLVLSSHVAGHVMLLLALVLWVLAMASEVGIAAASAATNPKTNRFNFLPLRVSVCLAVMAAAQPPHRAGLRTAQTLQGWKEMVKRKSISDQVRSSDVDTL